MYLEKAILGVAQCPQCGAVGTIVEMKKCCRVAALSALGPLWDVPHWMLRKVYTKRSGKRSD